MRGHQPWLDPATGELRPSRCRRRTCPVCLPINAWAAVDAVTMARPENFIRLTMTTLNPRELLWGMSKLRSWWRDHVGGWQDVYVIEKNPTGSGLHLHGWQHGSRVDAGDLGEAAVFAGFLPDAFGEPRELPDGGPLGYFLKSALYQPALAMPPEALDYLTLNSQMVHSTHGFWRTWDGERIGTRRDAEQLARGRTSPGVWVTTTV